MSERRVFPFRFSWPMQALATLFGGRHATVTVTDDELAVRYGVIYRMDVPLSAVCSAAPTRGEWWWGIGAHGWKRRWVVNGSSRDLVLLELEPEQRGRTLGIPVHVRQLVLSVQDTEGFIAAVGTAADRR